MRKTLGLTSCITYSPLEVGHRVSVDVGILFRTSWPCCSCNIVCGAREDNLPGVMLRRTAPQKLEHRVRPGVLCRFQRGDQDTEKLPLSLHSIHRTEYLLLSRHEMRPASFWCV